MEAMKSIDFKGARVRYADTGEGVCILLVHGYLESHEIWDGFIRDQLGGFRVIAPDLPGHGRSGIWGETHTMEDLAGSLHSIMEAEGIRTAWMVGHSMGGYVTLAFAEMFPGYLSGYCLFHSTCFADSEEKKMNRDREISLVRCGKKHQIISVNIPKGFAGSNLARLRQEVERAKKIALESEEDGIVAILNGMKARPDRSAVLQDRRLPQLLIGGMKDNYIPGDVFDRLVALAPHAAVVRLENSGHMGFVEEPWRAAGAIINAIKNMSARD
ncbi:MAG: alpha/beta hydrolase [Bacteroidetes bacterium]|nr:MAG: alpha/beta hydrolase [Bacteroidota bacterium]